MFFQYFIQYEDYYCEYTEELLEVNPNNNTIDVDDGEIFISYILLSY